MSTITFKQRTDTGCWEWLGALDRGWGKAWCSDTGRTVRAHRLMWQIIVGPIPDAMEIDHLCRNRSCIFPGHLELVEQSEHARRSGARSDAGVCHAGLHPRSPESTTKDGRCKPCRRRYLRDYYQTVKQGATA